MTINRNLLDTFSVNWYLNEERKRKEKKESQDSGKQQTKAHVKMGLMNIVMTNV